MSVLNVHNEMYSCKIKYINVSLCKWDQTWSNNNVNQLQTSQHRGDRKTVRLNDYSSTVLRNRIQWWSDTLIIGYCLMVISQTISNFIWAECVKQVLSPEAEGKPILKLRGPFVTKGFYRNCKFQWRNYDLHTEITRYFVVSCGACTPRKNWSRVRE